jgi:hypothetical protein
VAVAVVLIRPILTAETADSLSVSRPIDSPMSFQAHATYINRAVNRILANLKWDKFNSLEITQVAAKRFLGLPYVTVSAHERHIQESMFLCRATRLAEMDRAKSAAAST